MKAKITQVNRCPLCRERERRLICEPTKDNITSKIYQCTNCNLVYNGIRLANKNSVLLDDKFIYTEKQHRQWKALYLNKIKNIERIVRKRKGKLLEIGCGPGSFLAAAKERGWEAYGIEPFKKTFDFARSKGLNVKNATLESAGFNTNEFDLIIAIEVIEHFVDPTKEFKEMKRILKDDGVIIVQTGNVESILSKLKGKNWRYYYYDHLCYFSKQTISYLLEKLGMKIIKSIPDEVDWSARMKWCGSFKQRIFWTLIYLIRIITFKKPILGSMTLYISKK